MPPPAVRGTRGIATCVGRLDAAISAQLRASGENARPQRADGETRLTPQEFQIARFVAQGLSNREVAAQLFLSPRTVDFHLRNLFTKLGITSRTELATLQFDAHAPARPAAAAEAHSR